MPQYVPGSAAESTHGLGVPGRAELGALLVREVPAAGWASGAEEARPGVDGAWSAGGRLLHEAPGGGLAARGAGGGAAGDAGGNGPTGATFADAAAEYLRYVEHDLGRLDRA